MTDEMAVTLVEVVSEVMEQQAFMFADVCDGEEPETEAETFLHTRMKFEGPSCGGLSVAAPKGVCVELAANLLGVEPDDDIAEEDSRDALGEFLNVACGQLLTALYGAGPVFKLSIPKVEALDRTGWEALTRDEGRAMLLVDDAPVLLKLSVT
jgi:hypothetical protein